MSRTIRKNAFRKIESILRQCVLIREIYIGDMDDRNAAVDVDRVMHVARAQEIDRCYESDGTLSVAIHGNWFFTAYKSIDAARASLTPQAFAKYFPAAVA